MVDLFLSREELTELTGFKAPHCQVRWLTRKHWRFVLNRRNQPRVARQHFYDRMGCGDGRATAHADTINQAAMGEQPNFAALTRR